MIKLHNFESQGIEEQYEGRASFTEDNRWGTIEDGRVVSVNEDNALDRVDLNGYLGEIEEVIDEPMSDVFAVLSEVEFGVVKGVVPSKSDPDRMYRAGDWREIMEDGVLTKGEREEVRKYRVVDSSNTTKEVTKVHETEKEYEKAVIRVRSNNGLKDIGVIDLTNNKVSAATENNAATLKSHMKSILNTAPLFDPINLLTATTRKREIAIIDPDTNKEIKDPEKIQ